jgi:hypothetical protein
MIATEGTASTLRFVGTEWLGRQFFTHEWIGWRFRHAIFGRRYWRKFHLIHELAHIHGYRTILEISTAKSGLTYGLLDQTRFDVCKRLSYLTADDWTDGAPVDYRSCDHDTSDCLSEIQTKGQRFDIVFVDACHEYECSLRDIYDAINLVNDHGIIVLHDCLPDSEALCTPYRGDLEDWYGVTYKAYLDVLTARNDLWYCTVDADYGCGMIRRNRKTRLYKRAIDGDESSHSAWRSAGNNNNYIAAYHVYDRNRDALMNVVTVHEFLTAERKKNHYAV